MSFSSQRNAIGMHSSQATSAVGASDAAALDRIDRKMLSVLRRNGRMSNVDLAQAVNLSPTPCLRRLKSLERRGVIVGYRAEIDRRRFGFGVRAFIGVTRDRNVDRDCVWENITLFPEVIGCYTVSGEFDLLVDVVATDMDTYAGYLLERLMRIRGVLQVKSMFVLREADRDRKTVFDEISVNSR